MLPDTSSQVPPEQNGNAAGFSTSDVVYAGSSSLSSFSRIPCSNSPAARLLDASFPSPN